jgi:hypothetical protein
VLPVNSVIADKVLDDVNGQQKLISSHSFKPEKLNSELSDRRLKQHSTMETILSSACISQQLYSKYILIWAFEEFIKPSSLMQVNFVYLVGLA